MRAPPQAAPISGVPGGVAGETPLPQHQSFPQLRSHRKPTARVGNILTIESTDPIFSPYSTSSSGIGERAAKEQSQFLSHSREHGLESRWRRRDWLPAASRSWLMATLSGE